MKRSSKKLSRHEIREQKINRAMPEIKRLVRKYGRATVAGCLGRIYLYDKSVAKLNAARAEARRMARQLKDKKL